jgi:hypothetical protein
MRLRLLLILLVAISGLGADCGGGGHSSASADSSPAVTDANTEGSDSFAPAVPEPSAALVFGVGLLIAGAATRRNR